MKKLYIGGPVYGLHNLGDEAILESILKDFIKFEQLSIATYGSEWIDEKYLGVERIPIVDIYTKPKLGLYLSPRKKILENIRKIDVVKKHMEKQKLFICGGGTILSDCPWHALRLVELAGKANTPSIIWGAGMADGVDLETKKFIANICNKKSVQHIFLRDEFVLQRLGEIGVDDAKMTVSYDPVIMLQGESVDLLNYLTIEQISLYNDKRKNICISISGEADVINQVSISQLQETIKILTDEMMCNIFLIPTGCGTHCKDREILSKLSINQYCVYVEKEFSPQHLIGFLKNVDLVYSSRLHMSIFAACAGTPSVALIRNSKNRDFARLTGQPSLKLSEFKPDQCLKLTSDIIENFSCNKKALELSVSYMRNQHSLALKKAELIINSL